MEQSKKNISIIIAMAIIVILATGYYFLRVRNTAQPAGVVGMAKNVSESVPQIQTNPGENVPEINPLDRANPFKYTNPLR